MKTDMLSWLKETGGYHAIERFSDKKAAPLNKAGTSTTAPAATYSSTTPTSGTSTYNRSGTVSTSDAHGNRVDFAEQIGATATKNVTAVNGQNNYVRGYNGGQSANAIDITGNGNRAFAGQSASNNSLNVAGNANTINYSDGSSNNKIAINGSNVKINMGMAGGAAANSGWNIKVSANNVDISVSNGKAIVKVSEEMKDKLKVSIDEKTKMVTVSPLT